MVLRQALSKATKTLELKGMEESRLEAELLMRHVLGYNRAELHIRLEDELPLEDTEELDRLVQRRLDGEPVAYITGHKEFFGLDFYVNSNTLIPRPETEFLVEEALKIVSKYRSPIIADIGTGCGAISVAMAVHIPQAVVYAIDISAPALEVAAFNSTRKGVASRVHLLEGDLLWPLGERVDLILANLPYVSDEKMGELSKEIRLFEPELALSGGPDGLRQISRLLAQAGEKLNPKGSVLLEISPEQRKAALNLANRYFPGAVTKVLPDLSRQDRVIIIKSSSWT